MPTCAPCSRRRPRRSRCTAPETGRAPPGVAPSTHGSPPARARDQPLHLVAKDERARGSAACGPGRRCAGAGHRLRAAGDRELSRRSARHRAPGARDPLQHLDRGRGRGVPGPLGGGAPRGEHRVVGEIRRGPQSSAQPRTLGGVLALVVVDDRADRAAGRHLRRRRPDRALRRQRGDDPLRLAAGELRATWQRGLAALHLRQPHRHRSVAGHHDLPALAGFDLLGIAPRLRLRDLRVAVRLLQHLRPQPVAPVSRGRTLAGLSSAQGMG